MVERVARELTFMAGFDIAEEREEETHSTQQVSPTHHTGHLQNNNNNNNQHKITMRFNLYTWNPYNVISP